MLMTAFHRVILQLIHLHHNVASVVLFLDDQNAVVANSLNQQAPEVEICDLLVLEPLILSQAIERNYLSQTVCTQVHTLNSCKRTTQNDVEKKKQKKNC
jgi:hypothetical protein